MNLKYIILLIIVIVTAIMITAINTNIDMSNISIDKLTSWKTIVQSIVIISGAVAIAFGAMQLVLENKISKYEKDQSDSLRRILSENENKRLKLEIKYQELNQKINWRQLTHTQEREMILALKKFKNISVTLMSISNIESQEFLEQLIYICTQSKWTPKEVFRNANLNGAGEKDEPNKQGVYIIASNKKIANTLHSLFTKYNIKSTVNLYKNDPKYIGLYVYEKPQSID